MPGENLITGKVIFDKISKPFNNVMVFVRIEDVGRQDAQSTVISEQVIRNVNISNEDLSAGKYPEFDFALRTGQWDSKKMYTITAHVDVDGDGRISLGDYITQAYYPIRDILTSIKVHVTEVV